ncbi:hypothetical protein ACQ7HM_02520 [Williamsia sp. MIQD14]|uniref:hypothetical protein n=1 Tax=Williamsia sp. MIQD14 TaxID=3425703 RepID=UPI003DA186FC
MPYIDTACEVDIAGHIRAVTAAAAEQAGRCSDDVIGTGPLPGTPEWEAEQSTATPAQRSIAWHLLSLRIQVAAGLDGVETVVVLRVLGAPWAAIGRATGMSRQSAHERWGTRSRAVLDPVGSGLPSIVVDDDPR